MKKIYFKVMSFVVMITIVASNFSLSTVEAQNLQDNGQEKQYIVITNNENSFNAISDEYEEFISEDYEINGDLQEENILVTEMTETEAHSIESESGVVLVEEDGLVAASINNNSQNNKEKTQANKKDTSKNNVDKEWNIEAVNADDENKDSIIASSDKIKVAIIDSGLDVTENIDVAGRINLIPGEEEVLPLFEDTTGHGTSIAGIIAANETYEYSDVKGINDQVELYSAKVLDYTNSAPISRVIEGIYWAIDQSVDIINLSFGTTQNSEALYLAIKAAYDAGILIIAASGNAGGAIEYPAAYPEVMAVGSVDATGTISDFCSTGADMEVVAPGELIKSTGGFGGETIVSGTSMAVPHVVGIASVLWQKETTKSADFIRRLINESANYLGDANIYGNGLVDLSYALEIYDEFEDTYIPGSVATVQNEFENNSEIESFNDVDYVEGSWAWYTYTDQYGNSITTYAHQWLIEAGVYWSGNTTNLSTDIINLIKRAAIWPDDLANGVQGFTHPGWHGYYRYLRFDETKPHNYIYYPLYPNNDYNAGYCFMMSYALGDGNSCASLLTTYPYLYDLYYPLENLRKDFYDSGWGSVFKYWVIGLAIHTGTDVFAHSTAKKDGTIITHSMDYPVNGIMDADDNTVIPTRFSAAVLLSSYAMDRLVYNVNYSSYLDIYSVYNSDPDYYNNFNLVPFQ